MCRVSPFKARRLSRRVTVARGGFILIPSRPVGYLTVSNGSRSTIGRVLLRPNYDCGSQTSWAQLGTPCSEGPKPFRLRFAGRPTQSRSTQAMCMRGCLYPAVARKTERFELADEGTMFLGGVGDIAPELRCKLLWVLQQQFERLGCTRAILANCCSVAATNRDLRTMIARRRVSLGPPERFLHRTFSAQRSIRRISRCSFGTSSGAKEVSE
jgi:hypothetical protein